MANAKLVEKAEVEREYGLRGTVAVVDHVKFGRLLIADGYGGEHELCGGAVRWKHGEVIKLKPGDTLAQLQSSTKDWVAMRCGHDQERPLLYWTGYHLERLAKDLGLS